jgi:iron complex outermembrane receptor protein
MKHFYLRCLVMLLCMFVTTVSYAQQTVTGKVTDQSGLPLPGVSVHEKGTKNGTSTNAAGNFSITVKPGSVLTFSSIGLVAKEVTVGTSGSLDVSLVEDANALSEVVVTALGVKRESKSLGYAVNTVSGKDITQAGATNFASALYGKAPGVRIASATGGSTSGVNINIRGVNSITGKTQPLIVMDGVPIRDGEFNNNNYWGDQRMRGNGLLDLNPEDIESISILKGASAAALYGSEAVNGVVLVTTKSGRGNKGFTVDVNANYSSDQVAYLPRYQNVRGPGIHSFISNSGQDEAGFVWQDLDGNGSKETRGVGAFSINFGPKFDGQPTLSWDGQIRPYEAQIDNYAKFFQTANNSNVNVALAHGSENSNVRFSLTRQDNEGVSYGAQHQKNIANLNSTFKLGKKVTTDLVVNYINQYVHNRPFMVDRMINNFTGMIGRFDNPDWYAARYKTSRGYKYVSGAGTQSLTPSENILYPGFKADIGDYMWNVRENQENEYSDRVIASLTNTWAIIDDLKLRARISTDNTSRKIESESPNDRPLAFGNSGGFGFSNYLGKVLYGDALLTYTKKVTPDFGISAMAGITATRENYTSLQRETRDGLSVENWYDLNASVNQTTANGGLNYRNYLTKSAYIGTVSANYKEFLFLEGTLRQDQISTMNPDENSFVYPSVNSSFIFSEAFKLPEFMNYGRLRASYGIVGNYPSIYQANVAYSQNTLGSQGGSNSVLYTTTQTTYGNDFIKPERKKEYEFGLETKFFNGRLGLDVSYYNGQIIDQILNLTLPSTSGATAIVANVGTLRNKGVEIGLTGAPLRSTGFNWNTTVNFSFNKNVVEKLANGATELLHADYDGNAAQLKSIVGQPMGDIYIHPIATDASGQQMISADGLYQLDANNMVKVGNAMPKVVGGFINNFNYKNFSLDVVMDFRVGGHVMPTGINWMISRGLLEESLNYMDEASGGLSYFMAGGKGVQTSAGQGPNGEKVYHDGMLMQGVTADGKANTNVISQAYYYWNTYNWGGPQYSSSRYELYVKKNSYVKMREISFGYKIPASLASRLGAKNLQISAFGRNLFFVYRTLKDLDPEQMTAGSRWDQTINNAGSNPATRTYGLMLRANF